MHKNNGQGQLKVKINFFTKEAVGLACVFPPWPAQVGINDLCGYFWSVSLSYLPHSPLFVHISLRRDLLAEGQAISGRDLIENSDLSGLVLLSTG